MKRLSFLAVPLMALVSGCQMGLPAVNLTEPLAASIKFGPSVGVAPGVHVVDATFPLGEFCDAIDQAAIEAQVRAVLGDTVSGMIKINRILLTGIVFTTRTGNFLGFESMSVNLTPASGAEVPFGSISGDEGLGSGFTLDADQEFDAAALLGDNNCLTATLIYTGTTPAADLNIRMDAYITVEASTN